MKFRPCIDIHNGKVKQIVGGSLKDAGDQAEENFVSEKDGAYYARLYKDQGLSGGHIILLNPASSPYYPATKNQALRALQAYPGGLQIGGGINDQNAGEFLAAGASHVIVTSFVFRDGKLHMDNLEKLVRAAGREHVVLDVSCRRKGRDYYIVTDRWQKFTEVKITPGIIKELSAYCDEFLVHAVDVEGKAEGPELELVQLLGEIEDVPVTYAGGIRSMADIHNLKAASRGRLDITIGSALDLFGGELKFDDVRSYLMKV